jgi:poly(3-hydroxybutyrate) depolymerase
LRSDATETVIEARFHTDVLIADVRGGVITAGFQRNRDSAELLTFRVQGKDKLSEERPKFEKRMLARPSQFSEAMEFNTVGEPRYSWEVARESPSHLLPALHEIEVLPVNAPKAGERWQGMNPLGMVFEWVGSEPLHGKNCYHVKGTSADGSVTLSYWWSPESGVIERVELDGTYPVFGGTSHEQARMELETHTRGEAVSDWLVKPEIRLGALEALLLSPSAAVTSERLAADLSHTTPAVQRLALAVARRRGWSMPPSELQGLAGSADSDVRLLASDLLSSVAPAPPVTKCPQAVTKKAEPEKFGTLFRVATAEKGGPGVPYFLRIPLSYRPDRATALLVYLSGGAGIALDGVNTANDVIANTDYLVLYPQAAGYWWKPEVAARLDAALRDVFREFNVDRDRVYIAGFSNGGTGALYIAELWPQRFAAVVSLMGAGQCMEEVKQMLPNLVNLPLLFVHGEKDPIIAADCSKATYEAIGESHPRLSGHLKTGQRWSGQNRPTEVAGD